jgi:tetratricopeptide (TPR) repeat protein
MSVSLRPIVRAAGLATVIASGLGAQAQKSCEVNEGRPSPVGRATLAVQVASSTQDPSAAARQLTSAVKFLTDNGEKMDNQVGRNLVLGKALVLWSMQPNVELVTRRGSLGYSVNPDAMVDLAAAIDTAFKVVETANPECIAETSRWRSQRAWVGLVNKAIERLNADDVDAAAQAAQTAIVMNPYGPYGYVVLANVKQKQNKSSEAFGLYQRAIDAASRDTSYDEIRRQSLIYLGNLAADSAELVTDTTARRPYVQTAQAAFEKVLADKGADDLRENARSGMCRVAIAAGDTSVLRTMYKDPLTAPGGFGYSDLMNAGVCMARAEMVTEATQLFQAAYEKNPYHRDALSNLAIMHLRKDNHDAAIPLAERLVSVEPNNPENHQLLVLAYAGVAKRAREARLAGSAKAAPATKGKTPAKAAPAGPRLSQAAQDSLFKIEQEFNAKAVAANEKREKLAFKVSLSDFSITDEKSTVAGTVQNTGSADKDVTVKVDFLDRTGRVVATKEAAVGNVAAGRSGRFSVTTTPGKEVAAFRYAPIE